MKTETLATLSARLGVSITSISRIINGKAEKYRISPATEERVMREVQRCGYMPAGFAQNLRNPRSGLVGLILPSVSNPFFADMAAVIISELYRRHYTTIVLDSMEDESVFLDSVKTLLSRQVEGMIAVPCGEDGTLMEAVGKHTPLVLVDRFYKDTQLSYVTTNNYQGSLEATRYLLDCGHTRIACIQGATASMPNQERVSGYRDAMRGGDKEAWIKIVGNEFSVQNGYLETKLLLAAQERPTALFALSNTILLGAVKAIREAGLRIPNDISLIAFDDNLYMDYMTPVITRVSQPVTDMAFLATKLLVDSLGNDAHGGSQLRLSPTLIHGGSVSILSAGPEIGSTEI